MIKERSDRLCHLHHEGYSGPPWTPTAEHSRANQQPLLFISFLMHDVIAITTWNKAVLGLFLLTLRTSRPLSPKEGKLFSIIVNIVIFNIFQVLRYSLIYYSLSRHRLGQTIEFFLRILYLTYYFISWPYCIWFMKNMY